MKKYFEVNGIKLRLAHDLNNTTIQRVGLMLSTNVNNDYIAVEKNKIVHYINNLAANNKIKHHRVKTENGVLYFFSDDDVKSYVDFIPTKPDCKLKLVKIQCYNNKENSRLNIPIEISSINDLISLPKGSYQSGSCIYFLCKKQKVVYIGQSTKLFSRLEDHVTKKDFDDVFFFHCPENQLSEIENALITYLKPKYNKTAYNLGDVNLAINLLSI